ncbi:MAG TPA: Crp/Fnr family transcriptional regulator [Chryseosolibacter sp.]
MIKLGSIFPEFDEQLISYLLKVGEQIDVSAGELLLRPGQYVNNTMLVLDGVSKLYLQGDKGEELFLYFLEPGTVCALSILCATSQNINVTAKALTDMRLLIVSVDEMDRLVRNYPNWYHFLIDAYQRRFRELLQTVYQVAFQSLDEKLVAYLRKHFTVMKTKTVSMTHQDIASDLNSSREVISRLLKKLETDNKISISRNEITNLLL